MLTRRQFLRMSALVSSGLLIALDTKPGQTRMAGVMHGTAGHRPQATLPLFTEQLVVPPVIDLRSGSIFQGVMASGTHQFHQALPPTPTWGYGGASYLGPTFEVQRGTPVTIKWTNNLGPHRLADAIDTTLHGTVASDLVAPRTAVHLHGGHVAPESDGGPDQTFDVGTSYTYDYKNDQEAATLWYHDHALGITRLNVYGGLAGFYVVRDEWDTGRPDGMLAQQGVPTGAHEIPLVIQDKMFHADGTLDYPLGPFAGLNRVDEPDEWSPEFFGDVAVVNGKVWPSLTVEPTLYRFRIINGSNARFYNLKLSTGAPMYQIGTDGGLLNAPVALGQLLIAPGERADLLIDFSGYVSGSSIILTNNAVAPYPSGPRPAHKGGMPLRQIMRFVVNGSPATPVALSTNLRPSPLPAMPTGTTVRNLTLVEVLDPTVGAPLMALLNNLPWHTDRTEKPKVNTVEQWNIINTTMDAHPIHLHLAQFRLLSRQKFDVAAFMAANYPLLPDPTGAAIGPYPAPSAATFAKGAAKAAPANEAGWKDTIRAMPGEITSILVPFGGTAAGLPAPYTTSITGDYVWHCHILEHEDNEMMLPYQVVG